MKWAGMIVMTCALLTGACGGSADTAAPEKTASSSPAPMLDWAEVCPKIQDALYESMGGEPDYAAFADSIDTVLGEPIPQGATRLVDLLDASRAAVGTDDVLRDEGAWLEAMERVSATCTISGAPLD